MKYFFMSLLVTVLFAGSPLIALAKPAPAVGPLTLGGDDRVVPAQFNVTVFASGLDYPYGMVELADGSLLVASSDPKNKPTLFASNGELLRFVDINDDGVADGPGTVLYSGLPGVVTGLAIAGDLVFVASSGSDSPRISVLRTGPTFDDELILQGSINLNFPTGWEHRSYGLAVRPGTSTIEYELFFNLGSDTNGSDSVRSVPVSGLINDSPGLVEAALYSVSIMDMGNNVTANDLTLIATGLRNAVGFGFHPVTGHLYITDNGIDNRDTGEPTSADELNIILDIDVGNSVEDFGYADNYTEYSSGDIVGDGTNIMQPLVAFLPTNGGAESEGPAGIAFAPSNFPAGLNEGIFVGFHGKASAGLSNEENPLVYVDLSNYDYFHIVANTSPNVGHLNSLLATRNSLFVADLSSLGSVENGAGSGVIYQIRSLVEPPGIPRIVSPAAGATVSGAEISITAEVSNETGITQVEFFVNGISIGVDEGASPYEVIWDSTSVSDSNYSISATASGISGPTGTDNINVTVVNESEATTHVHALEGSTTTARGGKWNVTVTIAIHDENDIPIFGTTVNGTWSEGTTGAGSCVTNGSGKCDIAKFNINRKSSSVTFSVTSVTLNPPVHSVSTIIVNKP